MKKVFIDGAEGTTGLKLAQRLEIRDDITLVKISDELRKDKEERARLMNSSDFVFLCLPDAAAIEAVSLVKNPEVRLLDASTAHRTNPDFAYGFPELSKEHRERIKASNRVAVPGCYASGMLALVYPLQKEQIVDKKYLFSFFGISGYTGGGKNMIAQYEATDRPAEFNSPRQYALTAEHKHLAEVTAVAGLAKKPLFNPIVCSYPCGMTVNLPIYGDALTLTNGIKALHEVFFKYYEASKMIRVMPLNGEGVLENGFLGSNSLSEYDNMQIFITGNDERINLISRFDNLGKGASGAAIQNMNIMMGIDETTGLRWQ